MRRGAMDRPRLQVINADPMGAANAHTPIAGLRDVADGTPQGAPWQTYIYLDARGFPPLLRSRHKVRVSVANAHRELNCLLRGHHGGLVLLPIFRWIVLYDSCYFGTLGPYQRDYLDVGES
jgi:hypothetical protein